MKRKMKWFFGQKANLLNDIRRKRILMSYFVNGVALSGPGEKLVWRVEHNSRVVGKIFIGVDNARRNDHGDRVALSDQVLFLIRRSRVGLFPQNKLKVARTNETK